MLTEREFEILKHVKAKTVDFITSLDFENLETDAKTIGVDLSIDRSNVSRTLNNLYREGFFIKVNGRPTFFLDRESIKDLYPNVFVPSIIKGEKEIIQYLQPKLENKNEDLATEIEQHSEIIGIKPNESLNYLYNRLKVIASYPNHQYNVLLEGNDFTGRETIANTLHSLGHGTGNYSDKMGIIDFKSYIHDLDILRERTHKHLTKNIDEGKVNLVLLKNIDEIPSQYAYDIYKHLKFLQSSESPIKRQYIATSTTSNSNKKFVDIFFDEKITMPIFEDKTIKEKVEFILTLFQEEANDTQMSICLTKNVLSCFVMAKYPQNLRSLRKEIKFAVSNSYYRHIHSSSNTIDIDLDDLSDDLLNSIINVTNRLSNLEQIFEHIGDSNIYFIPENTSREREVLKQTHIDHHENIIHTLDNLQKLSMVCKKEVHDYSNKKITTIRSIYIKDIYNILYPIIMNFNPRIPDNIIFGLFMHLENIINTIQDGNYRQYYYSDIENVAQEIIDIENKISEIIFKHFNIQIPTVEKQYIRAYLDYAQAYDHEGNIALILISRSSDLEEAYKNYVHKHYKNIKINTIRTFENFRFANQKIFLRAIIETVDKSDQGKGVLIITDVQSLLDYEEEIEKQSQSEIAILSPISLPLLSQVANLISRREVKLADLLMLDKNRYSDKRINNSSQHITHPNEMIHQFSDQILAETLIFLDSNKAINVLSHALMNIYNELNIPHDDSITIRFIHHCSFMIERVIRNEPLNYKNTKDIIFNHEKCYQIVEKQFQLINNNFGINIPSEEIALVANIFIEKQKEYEIIDI